MFLELAKFRRVGQRQDMPVRCDVTHSNANLPGFRRPAVAGRRRPPTPALACHWVERNSRLECRWRAETSDAPIAGFDGDQPPAASHASGQPSFRRPGLALAG